jgi:hypothetical protein
MDDELYWYALVFQKSVQNSAGYSATTTASIYMGWPSRKVTLERIAAAKKGVDVPDDAVIISCSYLGFMTRAEFTGEL